MADSLEVIAARIFCLAIRDITGFGRVGPSPVLSVVRDTKASKIYVGLNTGSPNQAANVLRQSVAAQKQRIAAGEVIVETTAPMAADGGHSEVNASNPAIRERKKLTGRKLTSATSESSHFIILWLRGSAPGRRPL
jgi:hypothetical protein